MRVPWLDKRQTREIRGIVKLPILWGIKHFRVYFPLIVHCLGWWFFWPLNNNRLRDGLAGNPAIFRKALRLGHPEKDASNMVVMRGAEVLAEALTRPDLGSSMVAGLGSRTWLLGGPTNDQQMGHRWPIGINDKWLFCPFVSIYVPWVFSCICPSVFYIPYFPFPHAFSDSPKCAFITINFLHLCRRIFPISKLFNKIVVSRDHWVIIISACTTDHVEYSNTHHQESYIFRKGSRTKPDQFVKITSWVEGRSNDHVVSNPQDLCSIFTYIE